MSIEKLKEVPQSLWLGTKGHSASGICFYMSEYVQVKIWNGSTCDQAVDAARNIAPATIMKYGKAKNLMDRNRKQLDSEQNFYTKILLAEQTIFRMLYDIGAIGSTAVDLNSNPLYRRQNHAGITFLGGKGAILFFDPNHGFYEITDPSVADPKALLQRTIADLYAATGWTAANFIYSRGTTLNPATKALPPQVPFLRTPPLIRPREE